MTAPPAPFHILRSHSSPLATTSFNTPNTLLYAGDQDGFVSITDLRTRRVANIWKAHEGGVLGVEDWSGSLISQGRDNLIHMHEPIPTIRGAALAGAAGSSRPSPKITRSMDTNSLNFCRFSVCDIPSSPTDKGKGKEKEGLMAVPNLVDSELVDIYHLPSLKRVHASINYVRKPKVHPKDDGMSVKPEDGRTGLVMSLYLGFIPDTNKLRLVVGFEDGRVEVWKCEELGWESIHDARLDQNAGIWSKSWEAKGHNEAVMAMTVDGNLRRAFTVSADHLLVQYDLTPAIDDEQALAIFTPGGITKGIKSYSTGQIGNASIALSYDGGVVAVGGWDGKIRLFSAATLKPLGVLAYHRETVHSVAFANPPLSDNSDSKEEEASTLEVGQEDTEDEDDEAGLDGVVPRWRWLATGGKDRRVALWGLKDFAA